MEKVISPEIMRKAMSYVEYRNQIDELLKRGQTTGPNQSEKMVEYTNMNVQRMQRWDKKMEINDDLKAQMQQIDRPQIWLVLTEAWCGDAAQNVPILYKIASQSDKVDFKLILRDENPKVMDAYLTNGSKSIPKLIAIDAETFEEIFTWGPRPKEAQDMVMAYKANPGDVHYWEFVKELHLWYAKDKGQTLQKEFMTLVENEIMA